MSDGKQTRAKQLVNEDLIPVPVAEQVWHALDDIAGGKAILCTGEFVSFGDGQGTYEFKKVYRGHITCRECLARIRAIKAIRL